MKPGTRLKSAVCDTEVLVIRSGASSFECGGAPMSEAKPAARGSIDPAHSNGTLLGKRYVDAAGTIELLCVKPGKGSLSASGEVLKVKEAKPLPASD